MELIDYVRMLSRRWKWWVTFLVGGTLLGIIFASAAPKTYSATTEAFVGSAATGPTSNTTSAVSDSRRTILDSMASYSALVDAPSVLEGVLEDVPTSLTQAQLATRLSAVHIPRTVVLRVTATSSKPSVAAALSAAAAKRLGAAIQNLETPTPGALSPVKVIITRPAPVPVTPTSPNRVLSIALGLLAGLGLGLISASLRDQAVRTAPSPEGAAPGSPAAGTDPEGRRNAGRNRGRRSSVYDSPAAAVDLAPPVVADHGHAPHKVPGTP